MGYLALPRESINSIITAANHLIDICMWSQRNEVKYENYNLNLLYYFYVPSSVLTYRKKFMHSLQYPLEADNIILIKHIIKWRKKS